MKNGEEQWFSRIVVVEPLKRGYSHAIFNASLLYAIRLAFPGFPIRFFAHESHTPWVKEAIASCGGVLDGIEFHEETGPDLPLAKWERLRVEWQLHRRLHRRLSGKNVLFVFASLSPSGLFALKFRSPFGRSRPTLAILHCLQDLLRRRSRLRDWPFDLTRILRIPSRRDFKLVALGESVLEQAQGVLGYPFACSTIDLPRFRPAFDVEVQKNDRPSFAFVGVTAKGFDFFEAISRELHGHKANPRFVLAGYVNSDIPEDAEKYIEGLTREPIPQVELEARLQACHYVIWAADPEVYRLTASATFVDAMCAGVPVLAVENDFMSHYFKTHGAGKLCVDAPSLRAEILTLLADWPDASYPALQKKAEDVYARFSPASVSMKLRAIAMEFAKNSPMQ